MKITTRDGLQLEGDFSPELLKVILERERVARETPAAEDQAATADEATAETVKPAEDSAWVGSARPKRKPEPEVPQNLAELHDTTGLTTNVGGINDTFDPRKGKYGFQFKMPKEA